MQSAYLVADVETAARLWTERWDAGPFVVAHNIELRNLFYRGSASRLDHSSAYGWLGDEMIELVQQNCDTESVFSGRAAGLHHRAYFALDLDAELNHLEQMGWATAMTAETANGLRFAFADANAQLGHYVEVYQHSNELREFYQRIEKDHRDRLIS